MIRKGIKFRRSHMIIMAHQLPKEARGERKYEDGRSFERNYVNFHRITRGPVKGSKMYVDDSSPLVEWHVRPVRVTYHSRTNMAYGIEKKDYATHRFYRNVYWAEDGYCYTAKVWKPEKV